MSDWIRHNPQSVHGKQWIDKLRQQTVFFLAQKRCGRVHRLCKCVNIVNFLFIEKHLKNEFVYSAHGYGRRRFDRQCGIFLLAVIFTELIVTNTCDAAKHILQPPNDVMKMNGRLQNSDNSTESYVQLADGKILKRDKRYLLFSGGGISKVCFITFCSAQHIDETTAHCFGMVQVVLGFLTPVETRDRVNWRTLNLAYNFQAQYVPIPSVIFLWDRFSRSLIDQRRRFDTDGMYTKDLTRSLIYAALEMFLDRNGRPGRQCLLKAICEAAEHPIARTSVFDEIAHLVLT